MVHSRLNFNLSQKHKAVNVIWRCDREVYNFGMVQGLPGSCWCHKCLVLLSSLPASSCLWWWMLCGPCGASGLASMTTSTPVLWRRGSTLWRMSSPSISLWLQDCLLASSCSWPTYSGENTESSLDPSIQGQTPTGCFFVAGCLLRPSREAEKLPDIVPHATTSIGMHQMKSGSPTATLTMRTLNPWKLVFG